MAEQTKINTRVWVVLAFAWIAIASASIISFGLGMMMPGIVREFGVDTTTMGQLFGISALVQVITLIPLSLILAKVNPKISITLIMLGISIGFLISSQARNMLMLYIGFIVFAPFSANVLAALLVGTKLRGVPPEHMVQVNGIENFAAPIGQLTALLSIPILIGLFGTWRGVFFTVFVIITICYIFYFISWGNGKQISYGQGDAPQSAPKTSIFSVLKETVSNKFVWITGIAWPGTTIIWIAMFLYWPTYAVTTLGVSLSQAGIVLAMIPLFSAISSLVSPSIAKKIGYDKPLICCWGILLPVFYFMMTVFTNVPLLMLFSALTGFGAYFFVPLAYTNMYKIGLSRPAIAIAHGIILTFVLVGVSIAGNVIGALIRQFDGNIQSALRIACFTPIWFGILTLFLPELGYKKMQQLKAAKEAAGS